MRVRGKKQCATGTARRYTIIRYLGPMLATGTAWPCAASGVTYTVANTIDMGNGTAGAIAAAQQAGWVTSYQSANLWTTSSSGVVTLNPSGFSSTSALATTGVRQAGYGYSSSKSHWHALLWTGTSQSAIDLHPTNLPGFIESYAWGIAGNQQFGYGLYQDSKGGFWTYALLWTGSANSAVNLNPTNLTYIVASRGYTTDGVHQGGWGLPAGTDNNIYHAMLWSGTADSAVDLHPTNLTGFSNSLVASLRANQQVGQGTLAGGTNTHAMLWSGTSDSAIDLNPTNLPGFTISSARATNGTQQAGYGQGTATGGTNTHALLWSGTADTAVDLNSLIPGGATSSRALAIDAYGNIAGDATVNGAQHAVVWLAGNMYLGSSQGTSWGYVNWSSGKPVKNSDVLLVSSNGTSHTVAYDFSTAAVTLNTLTIDATNSGSMTLEQDSNTLTTTNTLVGFVGTGSFNQPAGKHVVNGTLTLGTKPGSAGTYTLGYSATLSAVNVQINAGSTFTQNGGGYTSASFTNNGSFTQAAGSTASLGAVTGTGSLTLSGTATATALAQGALALTGSGKLTLAAAGTDPILLHSLSINSTTAYLDTASHPLLLDYTGPTPIDQIRQYLLTRQLRSAATAADPQHPLALAYAEAAQLNPSSLADLPVDPTSLILKLTLPGDANLDGSLTPDDYVLLDRSLALHLSNAHWTDGDFNYDGTVNSSDYLLIDTTYGQAQGFSPGFLAERQSQFGEDYVSQLLASVPEPSLLAACGLAPLFPLARRRRGA